MKVEIEFFSIKERPLPTTGHVLVNVIASIPGNSDVRFVADAICDESGSVVDQDGDDLWFAEYVTHWASLPQGFKED